MDMLLSDAERARFADWLEHEAETAKAIIGQMEKLGINEALVKREKLEAAAALMIARKLRGTESMSIG